MAGVGENEYLPLNIEPTITQLQEERARKEKNRTEKWPGWGVEPHTACRNNNGYNLLQAFYV